MGSSIRTQRDAEPLPHVPVVLLCAEDDDLELVSFVHTARQHGLEPEVVPGVEDNGRPLRQALAQNGDALFVVLRSDNLTQARTLALKRLFERRSKKGQHLLALRLEPQRSEHAVQLIARRLRELMKTPKRAVHTSPYAAPNGQPQTDDDDHDSVPIDLGDIGGRSQVSDDEKTRVWPPKAATRSVPLPAPPEDLWDDRTVVADHLPRPPPSVTEHTVVADHLPRPPQLEPAAPAQRDVGRATDPPPDPPESPDDEIGLTVVPQPAQSPGDETSGATRDRPKTKSTNTGLWFALGLLALAAWHVATLFFGASKTPSAEPPARPTGHEAAPAAIPDGAFEPNPPARQRDSAHRADTSPVAESETAGPHPNDDTQTGPATP